MRIFKKILRPMCFLIVFILINALLSFALRPFSGSGSEMWKGFDDKTDIDLIYTGSSLCLCDIDPASTDKVTGLSSYNMGTNMQSIQSSFFAIQRAVEEKNVNSVVLLIDPETLEMDRTDNHRAEQCFVRNYADTKPFAQRITTGFQFVTDPAFIGKSSSIGYLFPWTYDRTSGIGLNIREKMSGTILDPADHRDANGFYGSDEVLDSDVELKHFNNAEQWSIESGDLHVLVPDEKNVKTLEGIAEYCNVHNVKLYVITPPLRTSLTYYEWDSYRAMNDTIRNCLGSYGIDYYNFTLIKEDIFDLYDVSLYRDNTHFNSAGAERFSTLLGEFMLKCDSGEDVSDMFYHY